MFEEGGKNPGGFDPGKTGVVGMKKNCCVEGERGVRPVKGIPLDMLGLGRLGSL